VEVKTGTGLQIKPDINAVRRYTRYIIPGKIGGLSSITGSILLKYLKILVGEI
jgi:hypothetical protein